MQVQECLLTLRSTVVRETTRRRHCKRDAERACCERRRVAVVGESRSLGGDDDIAAVVVGREGHCTHGHVLEDQTASMHSCVRDRAMRCACEYDAGQRQSVRCVCEYDAGQRQSDASIVRCKRAASTGGSAG